ATAPGHFAQYLRPSSDAALRRILASRRRSVWDSLLEDLALIRPYGESAWRSKNRVFGHDALAIWPHLDAPDVGPAIYYADPPYSKDHYSRYYHVLETLSRYDYPDSRGRGRYRPDRFRSSFAVKSEVVSSIRSLAARVAERASVLLLSYPSTGLLTLQLG